MFERLEIGAEIGTSDGVRVVVEAHDPDRPGDFALIQVRRSPFAEGAALEARAKVLLARAERQSQAFAADPERWAPIHGSGRTPDGGAWALTDRAPRSLADRMPFGLDAADLVSLVEQVAAALESLHGATGAGHGRLTPSNVLLRDRAGGTGLDLALTDPAAAPGDVARDDLQDLARLVLGSALGTASPPAMFRAESDSRGFAAGSAWAAWIAAILDPQADEPITDLAAARDRLPGGSASAKAVGRLADRARRAARPLVFVGAAAVVGGAIWAGIVLSTGSDGGRRPIAVYLVATQPPELGGGWLGLLLDAGPDVTDLLPGEAWSAFAPGSRTALSEFARPERLEGYAHAPDSPEYASPSLGVLARQPGAFEAAVLPADDASRLAAFAELRAAAVALADDVRSTVELLEQAAAQAGPGSGDTLDAAARRAKGIVERFAVAGSNAADHASFWNEESRRAAPRPDGDDLLALLRVHGAVADERGADWLTILSAADTAPPPTDATRTAAVIDAALPAARASIVVAVIGDLWSGAAAADDRVRAAEAADAGLVGQAGAIRTLNEDWGLDRALAGATTGAALRSDIRRALQSAEAPHVVLEAWSPLSDDEFRQATDVASAAVAERLRTMARSLEDSGVGAEALGQAQSFVDTWGLGDDPDQIAEAISAAWGEGDAGDQLRRRDLTPPLAASPAVSRVLARAEPALAAGIASLEAMTITFRVDEANARLASLRERGFAAWLTGLAVDSDMSLEAIARIDRAVLPQLGAWADDLDRRVEDGEIEPAGRTVLITMLTAPALERTVAAGGAGGAAARTGSDPEPLPDRVVAMADALSARSDAIDDASAWLETSDEVDQVEADREAVRRWSEAIDPATLVAGLDALEPAVAAAGALSDRTELLEHLATARRHLDALAAPGDEPPVETARAEAPPRLNRLALAAAARVASGPLTGPDAAARIESMDALLRLVPIERGAADREALVERWRATVSAALERTRRGTSHAARLGDSRLPAIVAAFDAGAGPPPGLEPLGAVVTRLARLLELHREAQLSDAASARLLVELAETPSFGSLQAAAARRLALADAQQWPIERSAVDLPLRLVDASEANPEWIEFSLLPDAPASPADDVRIRFAPVERGGSTVPLWVSTSEISWRQYAAIIRRPLLGRGASGADTLAGSFAEKWAAGRNDLRRIDPDRYDRRRGERPPDEVLVLDRALGREPSGFDPDTVVPAWNAWRVAPEDPVFHVSAYEAAQVAAAIGGRLPTAEESRGPLGVGTPGVAQSWGGKDLDWAAIESNNGLVVARSSRIGAAEFASKVPPANAREAIPDGFSLPENPMRATGDHGDRPPTLAGLRGGVMEWVVLEDGEPPLYDLGGPPPVSPALERPPEDRRGPRSYDSFERFVDVGFRIVFESKRIRRDDSDLMLRLLLEDGATWVLSD